MTCGPYIQWIILIGGWVMGVCSVFMFLGWLDQRQKQKFDGDSVAIKEFKDRHRKNPYV